MVAADAVNALDLHQVLDSWLFLKCYAAVCGESLTFLQHSFVADGESPPHDTKNLRLLAGGQVVVQRGEQHTTNDAKTSVHKRCIWQYRVVRPARAYSTGQ